MDTLGNRLQRVMEMENLNAGQFAKIVGIQRSAVSHLVGGRNNPSFDCIVKLMQKFPTLNIEWLLIGKGKPYTTDAPQKKPDAVSPNPIEENNDEIKFSESASHTGAIELKTVEPETLQTESESQQSSENTRFFDSPATTARKQTPSSGEDKRRFITRITVFYSDGTFEEKI